MGVRYGVLYCAIYIVCYIGLAIYAYPAGEWAIERWRDTLANIASASIGIALLVATIIEGGGVIMVILASLLKRELKEEGRVEERKAWVGWNNRRLEADRKGEEFTELPPSDSMSGKK